GGILGRISRSARQRPHRDHSAEKFIRECSHLIGSRGPPSIRGNLSLDYEDVQTRFTRSNGSRFGGSLIQHPSLRLCVFALKSVSPKISFDTLDFVTHHSPVRFSIITPSYRSSRWLKLCIASVADQDIEH